MHLRDIHIFHISIPVENKEISDKQNIYKVRLHKKSGGEHMEYEKPLVTEGESPLAFAELMPD